MWRQACKKQKRVQDYFETFNDQEFKVLYSKLPVWILKVCCVALVFQFGVYLILAMSFFSLGSYRIQHVSVLNFRGYKFDILERLGLIFASITNALWLPIFELTIWEMQHMVAVT